MILMKMCLVYLKLIRFSNRYISSIIMAINVVVRLLYIIRQLFFIEEEYWLDIMVLSDRYFVNIIS